MTALVPAQMIGGRYALFDELAAGGMATVHYGRLAGGDGFSKRVAIKRLHPQLTRDPNFVDMFLDEARLSARIEHPNVVKTLDVVREGHELFLVMEYVHGESLSRLVRDEREMRGPVPVGIALRIVLDVLAGLEAAHDAKGPSGEALGIVHRDVSPQNILVGADGIARLIDFGVAKARGQMRATPSGEVKGKLAYMAPEHLTGGALTTQSDLYAVSVVLWELVTGRRLFAGETEAQTLAMVCEGKVPRPSEIVELPRELDEIVTRGAMRDPRRRYALVQEMAAKIEALPGVAKRTEVKRWLGSIAGDVLEERERHYVAIESVPFERASLRPPPDPNRSPVTSLPVSARDEGTRTTSVATLSGKSRARSRIGLAALGIVLVAAISAGAFMLGARRRAVSPEPTTASAPAPEPTQASADPPAPALAPEPSASAPPAEKPRARSRSAAPRAAPSKSKRANCNPPYEVDSDGITHVKRECL